MTRCREDYFNYLGSGGCIPREAHPAFLLWAEATETSRPGLVLDLPCRAPDARLAARLLSEFAPLKYALLRQQMDVLRGMKAGS
jgi:hypothetical protein